MALLRKLTTMRRVLAQSGRGAVLRLAGDNLRAAAGAFCWSLRRLTHLPFVRRMRYCARPGGTSRLHVLYVTTVHEARHGQTSRYRIHNFMRALRKQADTRLETLEEGVGETELRWADLTVLMRAPRSKRTDIFFENATRTGVPVVFDIDDIIFLPGYFEAFCRTRPSLTAQEEAFERKMFDGFYDEFCRGACCTTSTPYIAQQMRAHGKNAFVIHNGLNARQLRIAAQAASRPPRTKTRTILYLSGSKTHERDFARAHPALERILAEFADVRLCVAGYLDLSVLSEQAAARTDAVPYMEWGKMMAFTARQTVNIAPLDVDNPFCHAKSELKYFEAALVGVPTVASPTDTFVRCICDGENGMLARTEEEWYRALKSLLTDKALYARIRETARQDALARYSPQATAKEALEVYGKIVSAARVQYEKNPPRSRSE